MRGSQAYTVKYRMYEADQEHEISLLALNKADAYDKAVYEQIPVNEGSTPYSAWVYSVTYNNGNYKLFKYTMEGNPY